MCRCAGLQICKLRGGDNWNGFGYMPVHSNLKIMTNVVCLIVIVLIAAWAMMGFRFFGEAKHNQVND